MRAWLRGVALWGPGFSGWETSRPILSGAVPYRPLPTVPPVPGILSATERRRTGLAVRLALTVAQQATEMAALPPDALRSVFGSANGDGAVVHAILETLAGPERAVSPTQFHNSVHNAAAGYWTIATGSAAPASCLGCHDATFGAALLKAMAELACEAEPVLLVVYDAPLPAPLDAKRPTRDAFAAGFVLAPGPAGAIAMLDASFSAAPTAAERQEPRLEALRPLCRGNPAARALPLLEAIARSEADVVHAALLDGRVEIGVSPCSTTTPSCG